LRVGEGFFNTMRAAQNSRSFPSEAGEEGGLERHAAEGLEEVLRYVTGLQGRQVAEVVVALINYGSFDLTFVLRGLAEEEEIERR